MTSKRRIRQISVGLVFLTLVYVMFINPPVGLPSLKWVVRITASLMLVYGALIEPRRLEVTRHRFHVADLSPSLEGFTILQLTDFHWGSVGITRRNLRHVIETANSLNADLVALTGDYIMRQPKFLPGIQDFLRCLTAKCGIYAVAGNHERHAGSELESALGSVGIRLLDNECAQVRAGDAVVNVLGVGDPSTRRDDLAVALSQAHPAAQFTLLLAHSPDIAKGLSGSPVDLALVGHTHGGQIGAPLLARLMRRSRDGRHYIAGWFTVGNARMYVNRGIGHMYPFRFLCRPEIALFELTRSAGTN